MAGYNNFSMSNNAVAAYRDGLCPASKIAGIPAKLVKKFCPAQEWHHSSKNYNVVEFYNPAKVRAIFGLDASEDFAADPQAVAALTAHKAASKNAPVVYEGCQVRWLEWGGTMKHPKATEMHESGCSVSVKGQTATITLADGKQFTKRLTTNGFEFKRTVAK